MRMVRLRWRHPSGETVEEELIIGEIYNRAISNRIGDDNYYLEDVDLIVR